MNNSFLNMVDDRIGQQLKKAKIPKTKSAVVTGVNNNDVTVRLTDSNVEITLANRSGIFVQVGDNVQISYKGEAINRESAYISQTPNDMVVCSEEEFDTDNASDNILYFLTGDGGGTSSGQPTNGQQTTGQQTVKVWYTELDSLAKIGYTMADGNFSILPPCTITLDTIVFSKIVLHIRMTWGSCWTIFDVPIYKSVLIEDSTYFSGTSQAPVFRFVGSTLGIYQLSGDFLCTIDKETFIMTIMLSDTSGARIQNYYPASDTAGTRDMQVSAATAQLNDVDHALYIMGVTYYT